jgi:hypothetical protein
MSRKAKTGMPPAVEAFFGTEAFAGAQDDLVWLSEHGALTGAAEILRERRRQVEALGHIAEHDDALVRDQLVQMAEGRLSVMLFGARHDHLLYEAGALLAAEIDRLGRAAL